MKYSFMTDKQLRQINRFRALKSVEKRMFLHGPGIRW